MMDASISIQLLFLAGLLSVISFVDVKTQTIPDLGSAALILVGVSFQWLNSSVEQSILAALFYFVFFWLVREVHRQLTQKVGLGFGDVKMAGAAGAWLTIGAAPLFVGIAAMTALLSVAVAALVGGASVLHQRIPFGPFLALSLLVCWLLRISDIEVDVFHGL